MISTERLICSLFARCDITYEISMMYPYRYAICSLHQTLKASTLELASGHVRLTHCLTILQMTSDMPQVEKLQKARGALRHS